jgi:hypothetical protein
VAYEGSPDWHRQLRVWRQRDRAIYVVSFVYVVFAANYIFLFFANVSPADHINWLLSAGICVLQDFVVLPVAVGLVIVAVTQTMVLVTSCRHRVGRRDLLTRGSVEQLDEVLSSSGKDSREIRRAFSHEGGLRGYLNESMRAQQGRPDEWPPSEESRSARRGSLE